MASIRHFILGNSLQYQNSIFLSHRENPWANSHKSHPPRNGLTPSPDYPLTTLSTHCLFSPAWYLAWHELCPSAANQGLLLNRSAHFIFLQRALALRIFLSRVQTALAAHYLWVQLSVSGGQWWYNCHCHPWCHQLDSIENGL